MENIVLLEDVRIHNNNIMDISSLYELSNLKVLALSNNPIPQEQIDFLKEQIPNCKIIFN